MKIAYILTKYPANSETFIRREMTQLRRQGFEISIFAAGGAGENDCSAQSFPLYYRPGRLSGAGILSAGTMFCKPVFFFKFCVCFFSMLKSCPRDALTLAANLHAVSYFTRLAKAHDIEHIHAGFLSWPACIGLAVAALCRVPFSISAHARDIFVEPGAIQVKAAGARFITCCSREGLAHLRKIIAPRYHDKLTLNYHGIRIKQSQSGPAATESAQRPSIIAVGRLVEKKGFGYLIEAFAGVIRNRPNLLLRIVGQGPQQGFLERKIRQHGLCGNVRMYGQLDNEQTISMIQRSTILAVPSIIAADGDRDGLANVILEAFSAGTCVIASDLPTLTEAVTADTGLVCKPKHPDDLAMAMEKLLANHDLRTLLAKNAQDLCERKFDIEKNCTGLAWHFHDAHKTSKCEIAHIIEGFLGGTSTYLCHVLPELKRNGFNVTLICSLVRCDNDARAKVDNLRNQGIRVIETGMKRSLNPLTDLYYLVRLIRVLRNGQFDIVHTHCSKAGALGRLAALAAGIEKRYHSSHCFAFLRCGNFLTKRIYLLAERLLGRITTKYVAVSASDADSALAWRIFDKHKISVICNGLSFDKASTNPRTCSRATKEDLNLTGAGGVVLTACRFVEYKGVFTFLKAAMLSKSNAVFLLAGEGTLRPALEKYARRHHLSNRVRFCGHISNMEHLYSMSDLVVLCSQREAQPYVILEAMRAKCAIMASDVPGNRELLADDRGFLFEASPENLAVGIDFLLNNAQKRAQLAIKAWEYVSINHTLDKQIRRLTEIYNHKPISHMERKPIAERITTDCR